MAEINFPDAVWNEAIEAAAVCAHRALLLSRKERPFTITELPKEIRKLKRGVLP